MKLHLEDFDTPTMICHVINSDLIGYMTFLKYSTDTQCYQFMEAGVVKA